MRASDTKATLSPFGDGRRIPLQDIIEVEAALQGGGALEEYGRGRGTDLEHMGKTRKEVAMESVR